MCVRANVSLNLMTILTVLKVTILEYDYHISGLITQILFKLAIESLYLHFIIKA